MTSTTTDIDGEVDEIEEPSAGPTERTRGGAARSGGNTLWTVVDLIRRNDGVSRTELARITGLSVQGISKVVARLIDAGIVVESGRVSVKVGKSRTRLSIVRESRYALGANLDRGELTMSLFDLSGRSVLSIDEHFSDALSPAQAVEKLGAAAEELLARSGVESHRIVGCGLGMAGPANYFRGIVTSPNNFFGWHDVPLASMVSKRMHMPVKLDNYTNMSAIAENWHAHRSDWIIVIYVGTGIGAGVMLNGRVYRGSRSGSGEFGHMVLDPSGPECVCGRYGCVEVMGSPAAVVDRYLRSTGARTGRSEPGWNAETEDHLKEIVRLAARGDQTAAHALIESGRLLGIAAGNLVTLLDVENVILAGPMLGQVGSLYAGGVENGLDSTTAQVGTPVNLTFSDLRTDARDLGAALLMLSQLTA